MSYAEIAVNTAVTQTYDYHIPDALPVRVGHLVRVSFGTSAQAGIVVHIKPTSDIAQTKPILEILDPEPVVASHHIALAQWMSDYYLTPIGQTLWLFLPPGVVGQSERIVHLLDADADVRGVKRTAIVEHLRAHDGQLSERALERLCDSKHLSPQLRALAEAGVVGLASQLAPPSVQARFIDTARLLMDADALLTGAGGRRLGARQKRIVDFMAQFDGAWVDAPDILQACFATPADLRKMAGHGWLALSTRREVRDSLLGQVFEPHPTRRLTPDQTRAYDAIAQSMDEGRAQTFLLHGVTGAGKTEVYLQAMQRALDVGKQALVLVPEIALTPQTVGRIVGRFGGDGGRVAIVHGSLNLGERYDTWQRARRGEIDVIVGTRSALFTVLPRPGVIVLDEEHDPSYKHSPPFNPPYYHARVVAHRMAEGLGVPLILASATPDLETMYHAQAGRITYLHLPQRIASDGAGTHIVLPDVEIVDMREELKANNRGMFSRALHSALSDVLARDEQAIVLLNRRGQATYVFCRDCGYVAQCIQCDTPLTYHRQGEALRCHHCGHQQTPPKVCPECASERIRYFGAGTQQVEDEVHRVFPDARLIRWDADTASQPHQHDVILSAFRSQQADILIGTQMIAKGLDLPRVTLVGVVSADPGLMLPDYRATERAFQLLAQVAGRAGRSQRGGRVIVQTYQPDHPAIQHARTHDYATFSQQELEARRQIGYPPYRRLARVLIHHSHPFEAERQAKTIAQTLRERIEAQGMSDTHLIGAVPCFFRRLEGHYRWQVLVRSPEPADLLRHVHLHPGIYVDIDPVDVL